MKLVKETVKRKRRRMTAQQRKEEKLDVKMVQIQWCLE